MKFSGVIMPKEKQLVHARIENPILVRKTLLESAILTTELLKSYQKLRKIRTEKKHYKVEFRQNLQEIKNLLEKLELQELPRPPTIPKLHTFKEVGKEIKKEKIKRIKQEKLLESESSELDSELRRLQEKLENL